jgi:dTDP-4-dehydrorhamnose reductase
MKIAVIGASGQLGQDLMRVLGDEVIGLTHEDLEITDAVSVLSALRSLSPDWVINTAAFHNTDGCEENSSLAFSVNAMGAGNVARSAHCVGAGVVHLSTDYVFGDEVRTRENPYVESDPTAPLNMYGVSKRAGERMVIENNPVHIVVRTAGLFGTATSRKGWTFPELMVTKARAGDQLRVVDDQVLSPTFTFDLARTIDVLIREQAIGLFHVTNEGECSWYELACAAVKAAGIDTSIEPIPTAIPEGKARRPAYSALTTEKLSSDALQLLRPWQDALSVYLREKGLIGQTVHST